MKIKYKNVCSIRNAEVDFELGKLVCICGESHQGKSALFYTLLAGLTNSPDFKRFINNEALKEYSKAFEQISLIDDDNNWFQVEAGTNYLHYRTNDAKYEKVGRKNIFELTQNSIKGFLYDPEDSRQIMNIQGEDDGLFPIDRSDSQIFKTYERLLSLSCTEDILRTIKLDVDDIDIKIADYSSSIQKSTSSISKIETILDSKETKNFIDNLDNVNNAYKQFKTIKVNYNNIIKMNAYIEQVGQLERAYQTNFDTIRFKSILNNLLKCISYTDYINLCHEALVERYQFDIQKVQLLEDIHSRAISLSKDISNLETLINETSLALKKVTNELSNIDTCPLCGKPIERG